MEKTSKIAVKDYTMTVCMENVNIFCNTEGLITSIENIFVSLRNFGDRNHENFKKYERIRALLKVAGNFGAHECVLGSFDTKLYVNLIFENIENLVSFVENMEDAVETEMISEDCLK